MALAARVTAPALNTRPSTRLPAPTVMSAAAMNVPASFAPAPIVVAPFTCQKTLHGSTPPWSTTVALAPSVSAPPTWKMNTASLSPSSVMTPAAVKPVAPAAL
jgi:hypothetical protein